MRTGNFEESTFGGRVVPLLILVVFFSFGTGNLWPRQLYKITASDADNYDAFGSDVAINGDMVIVGAQYRDEGGVLDSGAAYVYDLSEPRKKKGTLSILFLQTLNMHEQLVFVGHAGKIPTKHFICPQRTTDRIEHI